MLITNCCTSNRRMQVQNGGNGLQAERRRTSYNSVYLVVDELCEPQDLSSGHTSLLLRQFV
jgi:hypothetical protein